MGLVLEGTQGFCEGESQASYSFLKGVEVDQKTGNPSQEVELKDVSRISAQRNFKMAWLLAQGRLRYFSEHREKPAVSRR